MRINEMKKISIIILILAQTFTACTNITQSSGRSTLTTTGNPAFVGTSSTIATHTLKNVVINALPAGGANGGQNLEINLTVDTGAAGFQPLTNFCGLGQTNPCSCELTWKQLTADGSDFSRVKRLAVTTVQSGLVKCVIAQSVWDEIATGAIIDMNIVPGYSNTTGLSCTSIGYKKGTQVNADGNFFDSTLTPFRNIHRYACHTKRVGTYEINNKFAEQVAVGPMVNDGSGNLTPAAVTVQIGSQYCVGAQGGGAGNANGGGAGGNFKCNDPRSGYSSQNYYRNFYIKSDTLKITSSNSTYDCPSVLESIKVSAGTDASGLTTVPTTEQTKLWPFDTTFALATTYSPDWNVGVSAASRLYKPGDPSNSVSQACQAGSENTQFLTEAGLLRDCIGYAKKPNIDGTCGSIRDNNGRVRPLVRLRRYRAILPGAFQNDGHAETGNLRADEIYVADRLVLDSHGVATGEMIYGPKPCNYSWFDHEGIVNRNGTYDFHSKFNPGALRYATPGYVATTKFYRSDAGSNAWRPELSVNPDGMVFPNEDLNKSTGGFSQLSCSATLPKVVYNMGQITAMQLLTTNKSRGSSLNLGALTFKLDEIHLQPVDPWSPNYIEDTSFQACAPVSDPYLEPPLHFYKDANENYAWCTKPYPTQNPYWSKLNAKRVMDSNNSDLASVLVHYSPATGAAVPGATGAQVPGFTSHLVDAAHTGLDHYNSCTGTGERPVCKMTTGTDGTSDPCVTFLSYPRLLKPNTCDRTVVYDPSQDYTEFPLQASDTDIEDMLKGDLLKSKSFACTYSVSPDATKVGKKFPSSGCCGMISGTALLGSIQTTGVVGKGHLEPQINPAFPNVRFCGWPVK